MSAHKPGNHNAVSPYLLVSNVDAMLDFLKQTFGAEELFRMTLPDGTVKHAEAKIDDSIIMLGERPQRQQASANSTHVYVPSVDDCYRKALQAGGTSVSEPKDQDYGNRSAGVIDPEGNVWWMGTYLGISEL